MTAYVGDDEAKLLVQKLMRHQPLVHCDIESLEQLTEELAQTVIPDNSEDSIPLKLNSVSATNRKTGQEYKISFGRLIYSERIRHYPSLESFDGKPFTSNNRVYFDSLMPRLRASPIVINEISSSNQRFSILARLRWEEKNRVINRVITMPILIAKDYHNPTISNWEYAHQQTSRSLLRSILGIGEYI